MEKELKFALSNRSYLKLLALCKSTKGKFQSNTYFDDSSRSLRRGKAGLRIRIENSQTAFLTLKAAVPETAKGTAIGWHQRQEWETELPKKKATAVLSGRQSIASLGNPPMKALQKLFPKLELKTLRAIGTLHTLRLHLPIGKFKGELDLWTVHDRTFYELEVEATDLSQALSAVKRLFKSHGIPLRPRTTTKLAALFRYGK